MILEIKPIIMKNAHVDFIERALEPIAHKLFAMCPPLKTTVKL